MDVRAFRIELSSQVPKNVRNSAHRYLTSMLIENLDKATHVSTLEIVWQIDGHLQNSYCVLLLINGIKNHYPIPQTGGADSIQRHLTFVTPTLDVFHQFSSSPA